MPATSASSTIRVSSDLILVRLASADAEIKLKAIREVKNQIIGNRTKKLSYIKLGAVPAIAAILAEADTDIDGGSNLIVQSAAALGSFACGVDAGVNAVLEAGVFPHLIRLLSHVRGEGDFLNSIALLCRIFCLGPEKLVEYDRNALVKHQKSNQYFEINADCWPTLSTFHPIRW
ncbi:Armadillo repeat-containing protein 8 [Quillaja saponaria]|uniref:Armadillo repeat-containing protein 8 n=1 Tax=Quillaja saponaria TaxID=32244 RepID=A0AAD7LTU1_QUISA|nr:Armadillo repeat-containing protein 8 [Quillaja saponaria]